MTPIHLTGIISVVVGFMAFCLLSMFLLRRAHEGGRQIAPVEILLCIIGTAAYTAALFALIQLSQ